MKSSSALCVAVAGMALLSSGCFTTRLQDTRVTQGVKHDEWRSFSFWGLAGKAKIDVPVLLPESAIPGAQCPGRADAPALSR